MSALERQREGAVVGAVTAPLDVAKDRTPQPVNHGSMTRLLAKWTRATYSASVQPT